MKTYKLNAEYLPQDLENVTRIGDLVEGSIDIADALQLGEDGTLLEIREMIKEFHPELNVAVTDEIIQEMIDKDILVEVEDLSPAHEQDCREAIVAALTVAKPFDQICEIVRWRSQIESLTLIWATLRHLVLSNIVTLDSYDNNGVVSYTID